MSDECRVIRGENVTYTELERTSLQGCLFGPTAVGYKEYSAVFDDGYRMTLRVTRECTYADIIGPTQLHQYKYIEKYLRTGDLVLDLACGTGYGTKWLLEKGVCPVGVDISKTNIVFAKHRYPGIEFKVGSADDIPFDDNTFDKVVSVETLEHVENDDGFLGEVKRVLKPGGGFLVTTPHHGYGNPFHIREYYRSEFVEIMRKYFSEDDWIWITDTDKWMELYCIKR